MNTRHLGSGGLEVSAIGLGCMTMTGGYSSRPDRAEMINLLHRAVDLGVTFFDTAEIYGPHANEKLVTKAHRLEENLAAADVTLTDAELTELDELSTTIEIQGGRYPDFLEAQTNL